MMRRVPLFSSLALSIVFSVALTPFFLDAVPSAQAAENLQGQMPRMEFERLRHSFGALSRGQKVTHRFAFSNTGTGVLQVRSIHAACGCVNTRVEPKDTFAPGEKGEIVFEFDSSLFVGPVVRTITVDTNALNPATQTLTFTADVTPEIVVRPNVIAMGERPKEFTGSFFVEVDFGSRAAAASSASPSPSAGEVALERSSLTPAQKAQALDMTQPLRIVATSTSAPALFATVLEQQGSRAKVELKVQGPLPIGPFRERLSLWNNSRHMKELVVAITGEVVGHVKTSAKYLEFGVVAARQSVRRSLTLTSDVSSFQVTGVEVDLRQSEALRGVKFSELVTVTTERTREGAVVHFDMRVPGTLVASTQAPKLRNVNASGVFLVRTNDPDYKEIRVPFFGVLRKED